MYLIISYISFKGRFDLIPVDVNDDGCVAAKHYDQRKTPVVVAVTSHNCNKYNSIILDGWCLSQNCFLISKSLYSSRAFTGLFQASDYDYEKLATRSYDLWLVRWLMLMKDRLPGIIYQVQVLIMKDRLPGQWEDKDKVEQFLGNNWNQLWSVAYWKKSLKKFWAENIRLKDFGISLNSLPYCGRWRRFLQSNQWLCIAWKERGKIDRFITGESCEIFWWIA